MGKSITDLSDFRTVGLDLAVGLEACGSAHHRARAIGKLGHDARLMPPALFRSYVRRQKNDR
jgi:transposase